MEWMEQAIEPRPFQHLPKNLLHPTRSDLVLDIVVSGIPPVLGALEGAIVACAPDMRCYI
ncbi:MAG: hypothetical protein K0S36_2046 [Nitrosospira multiformis]|jgi:hypothetical protein|nr:hypothetical protein [Nitrosospira multiformis]